MSNNNEYFEMKIELKTNAPVYELKSNFSVSVL